MAGPDIISMGCRLNIAESEAMAADLAGRDDLIIINSCAVTSEAVRQTRQTIRRLKRDQPDREIIVTGCAAQIDPAQFAAMPEVARVIGNAEKREAGLLANGGGNAVADIFGAAAPLQPAVSGKGNSRCFIEVQNGCDHRCTFCIIPFGRGNSRSIAAGPVIDAVQAAVERGQFEVVLTGVDLTSYGHDLPGSPSLGLLVERILAAVPGLRRLRLSSLDSIEIDDRLFALLTQEARMMPHVHLSLQAGDDLILKRMKRRHARAEAVAIVERLKSARPEIAIGADIIAGFPTETEEMFANSLALIDDCDIVFGHIFPFSPRPGTPAARMPQLGSAIAKARAAQLRARADGRRAQWLRSQIGTVQSVLVEASGNMGHAANYATVEWGDDPAKIARQGEIVQVFIADAGYDRLTGRLI